MSFREQDLAASLHVPEQKPTLELAQDNMRLSFSSYPPLGQVTQASTEDVAIHAVLEVEQSRATESWQVAAWHSVGTGAEGRDWTETLLSPASVGNSPASLQALDASTTRIFFNAQLPIQRSLQFTFKFRQAPDRPWRWIRDELCMDDGVIIVNSISSRESVKEDIDDVIKDLNPSFRTKSISSQCPGTQLWSLEVTAKAADGDDSFFDDIEIGLPWGSFLRWFAVVRIWTPWLAPRQGKAKFELDRDAILCSFLNYEGRSVVLLAVSGVNDVMTVFRSSNSGRVVLHVRNDGLTDQTATVLAAVGADFDSANATVMYAARDLVNSLSESTPELDKEISILQDDVKPEWYENWYDGLGFCTWNALGQKLTDEKIFHAVDTLAKNNIKIVSLIIDDNWQSIDNGPDGQFQDGWREFEADSEAFPKGLKATISHIRSKHPNIQHIAVWHALLGYWGGISPNGKIAKTYKTTQVVRAQGQRRNLPLGGNMMVVAKEDVNKFYNDFYKFLTSCGIDAVKTDGQFMIDTWISAETRRDLITTYQDAWYISALRHFSIKAISCMSQVPQIMFYSQLRRNRPAVLVRNSDDFFPDIPSSHPWHIWANAHNSVFMQHLNVLPDWDMFQTVHDYSGFHAAARCVSGGPIYITDVPGEHNIDLIKQMTGVTPRGKTVIFRPSVLGRSIDQYVGYTDDSLLKVGSYHGAAVTGFPIMGVFNISTRALTEMIPLSRFRGVLPSMQYVVRTFTTGRVTKPLQTDTFSSMLTLSLDVRGYEILCAYPLSTFESARLGRVYASNLGLLGKMTGAAAVVSSQMSLQENGRVLLDTAVKALGVLGIYISKLPELSIQDHFMVTILGLPIPPHTVSVSKQDEHVVEIDFETAWHELHLQPGWNNGVEIKVYFSIGS